MAPPRGTRRAGARRRAGSPPDDRAAARRPAAPRSARSTSRWAPCSKPEPVEVEPAAITARTPPRSPALGVVEAALRRPPRPAARTRWCGPAATALSPSRSSSGRTSGSAYDIASSSSPNRSRPPAGAGVDDRHVAVVVRRRLRQRSASPPAAACPPARTADGCRRSCRPRRPRRRPAPAPRRARRRCGRRAGRRPRRSGGPSTSVAPRRPRRWASGISVACGESTAPTPTVLPRRSATDVSRRVGAHDDHRRQVAVGVAHRPAARTDGPCAAASRSARTQASGEFQATSIRPATRSSTWRS